MLLIGAQGVCSPPLGMHQIGNGIGYWYFARQFVTSWAVKVSLEGSRSDSGISF
jgi:hypothetical protein